MLGQNIAWLWLGNPHPFLLHFALGALLEVEGYLLLYAVDVILESVLVLPLEIRSWPLRPHRCTLRLLIFPHLLCLSLKVLMKVALLNGSDLKALVELRSMSVDLLHLPVLSPVCALGPEAAVGVDHVVVPVHTGVPRNLTLLRLLRHLRDQALLPLRRRLSLSTVVCTKNSTQAEGPSSSRFVLNYLRLVCNLR